MKPWLGHGSSNAFSALVVAVATGALAGATGCSSSSSSGAGPGPGGTDGGSEAGTGPDIVGTGPSCPANTHETVGAKITLTVQWPQTLANNGCDDMSTPQPCTGTINIWLLTHYTINGTAVTGTVDTCKNVTPPIPLTSAGTTSEGQDPSKGAAVVTTEFDDSVWTSIIANPMHTSTPTSGVIAGWNVGSSMRILPTDSVYGVSPTSKWASDKTTWPASESDIMAADITDDDNDGHPGITTTPSTANGSVLPAAELHLSAPFGPFADKLYVALRTELQLYGTSKTCNDIEGTVGVNLLNNHVIGCNIADGGACTQAQWDFIDSNTTVYVGKGKRIPAGTAAPSFAPPGITGTFVAKILSTDPAGGGIDCAKVISMLP